MWPLVITLGEAGDHGIVQKRGTLGDVSGDDMGCYRPVLVPDGFVAARTAGTRECRETGEMQTGPDFSLPELHDLGTPISISDF